MTRPRIAILCGALLAASAITLAAPSTASAKTKAIKCPTIVNPVCAVDREGKRQTFNNSCEATRARARILAPGECPGTICSFIFAPVCARVPGEKPKTFPNLCIAENANATLLHKGECK
jgi:hypothetical protein